MPPLPRTSRAVALALVMATPLLLAACTPTIALSPAPKANTVGCADVIVRLPSSLEGEGLRETDAQSTGAWGAPASIVLTCGITTPTVSDLPCFPVEGVDWLIAHRGKDDVYTTYGRAPGVQVVVDTKAVPTATNVLFDLGSAVGKLPLVGRCESVTDPRATPTP